ncbi:MAG: hypothetical protein NC409_11465 [Clostridium sp.]|nr:hypothetical protein [Clostridium sp.]
MKIDRDLIFGAILFTVYLISTIYEKYKNRPRIYKNKYAKKKTYTYDKTIYKPRKPENKGLPEGDFTHEHIESMWDEIK